MSEHFVPEPLWWSRARELSAPPYTLTIAAIGRLLKKDHTSVLYALGPEERRKQRMEYHRTNKRPLKPRTLEQEQRVRLVKRAYQEARATGRHVDEVLISWGEKPRRAR